MNVNNITHPSMTEGDKCTSKKKKYISMLYTCIEKSSESFYMLLFEIKNFISSGKLAFQLLLLIGYIFQIVFKYV